MSRAYRIKISESIRRTIRGEDRISTRLEILNVLPPEEMADVLAQELAARGFEEKDGLLVREVDGIAVAVNTSDSTVTVRAASEQNVELKGEEIGWSYEEHGEQARRAKQALTDQLRRRLEDQAKQKQSELQTSLTDRLEAALGDLRNELDQIANRVTATALKRKAAQMGQIKEISEDEQSGSLTIVLEV